MKKMSETDLKILKEEIFFDPDYLIKKDKLQSLKKTHWLVSLKDIFFVLLFFGSITLLGIVKNEEHLQTFKFFEFIINIFEDKENLISYICISLLFSFIALAFTLGRVEKTNKKIEKIENSLKYYDKTVSYKSSQIINNHYPDFYIKDKYLNKHNKKRKITYYELLDEYLFEQIFSFKKDEINKNYILFFSLVITPP